MWELASSANLRGDVCCAAGPQWASSTSGDRSNRRATIDHSDTRGSKPHVPDPSRAAARLYLQSLFQPRSTRYFRSCRPRQHQQRTRRLSAQVSWFSLCSCCFLRFSSVDDYKVQGDWRDKERGQRHFPVRSGDNNLCNSSDNRSEVNGRVSRRDDRGAGAWKARR